jgi:hypothetical protein
VRWPALAAGLVLVGVAFFAAGRVADTREGLVYEVITLLGGLAGVSLILYGLFANTGEHVRPASARSPVSLATPPPVQSANDLLLGGSGLLVAAILVIGIGINAGPPWALLGLVLLLPMVTGCAYLCFRFLRAPEREWRIDLERLTRHR